MSGHPIIRIGVLGCSRIAKKSVFQAIKGSSLAELAMIGSRDPQNARTCAQQFGCSFGTYGDVLASKDVDAVYISLPNTEHEEWVIKAAAVGKHVWCEKPAALTYASAKRMVDACRKNNVRLMEGFMFRYHPQHAKVRELINTGVIGEVLRVDAFFGFPMPEGGNIIDPALGGGAYFDACPYPIRASRMLFGEEPIRALCNMNEDARLEVPTCADMILEYPNGKSAMVSSMFGCYYQSTYRILGTKGLIATERAYPVPPDREVKVFVHHDDKEEVITIAAADHFRLMIDDFCAEISRSMPTKEYEDDLLAQARVLDSGAVSFEQGRVVNLAEIG